MSAQSIYSTRTQLLLEKLKQLLERSLLHETYNKKWLHQVTIYHWEGWPSGQGVWSLSWGPTFEPEQGIGLPLAANLWFTSSLMGLGWHLWSPPTTVTMAQSNIL